MRGFLKGAIGAMVLVVICSCAGRIYGPQSLIFMQILKQIAAIEHT